MNEQLFTIIANKQLMEIQFEDLAGSIESPKLKRILSNIARQEKIILDKYSEFMEREEIELPTSEQDYINQANIEMVNDDGDVTIDLIEQKTKLIEFYKECAYISETNYLTRLIEKTIDLEYKHIETLMNTIK